MTTTRETKYTSEVHKIISDLEHGTNAEITNKLREKYKDVSETTVHRVTSRLCERGEIRQAPSDKSGAKRFDSNIKPHDHFTCTNCGGLKDIDVAEELIPVIEKALGGCKVNGRLLINGSCDRCLKEGV